MKSSIIEGMGFSPREAKVYLALLKLGSSTITNIIKKSEVPSSKIYEVLDRLIQKGIVSYFKKGRSKHFQATDPENILKEFDKKRDEFKESLEELKQLQILSKREQSVELFEGKNAIFKALGNLLEISEPGDEYLSFSVGKEHLDKDINLFMANFTHKRVEKKLKIKVLSHKENKENLKKAYSKEILSSIHNRFTDIHFPQGLIILKDKLVQLSWQEPALAIIITSQKISDEYREFFYQTYNSAKK
jgi:HTH-type transcriptional regulator, sugar sensing transcriptional regulator